MTMTVEGYGGEFFRSIEAKQNMKTVLCARKVLIELFITDLSNQIYTHLRNVKKSFRMKLPLINEWDILSNCVNEDVRYVH